MWGWIDTTPLRFVHYNFVRMHKTLKMSPAMAAVVTNTLHDMAWLVGIVDAAAPAPKPRATRARTAASFIVILAP